MKKVLKMTSLLLVVAAMLISMVACNGNDPKKNDDSVKEESKNVEESKVVTDKNDNEETSKDNTEEESKTVENGKSGEGKTIGISLTSKSLARTALDEIYLTKYLTELGYDVSIQYSEGDVTRQVSQFETFVTSGVDGIIISPSDGTALTTAMELADENDVPVLVYDALIMNSPFVKYYVTDDLFKVGKEQGDYIVEALGLEDGEKGPFNLELFTGSMTDNNAIYFYDGAMSALQPYIDEGVLVVQSGQITFAETSTEKWDAANAQTRCDTILSTYYTDKNLDAALTQNDNLAIGVISSLKSVGYGTDEKPLPITTGQDCDVSAIKSIIAGEQSMTVFKDIREFASAATYIIDAMIHGDEVVIEDPGIYNNNVVDVITYQVKPLRLTKDNWYELIIENGFYTPEDLDMTAEEALEAK